MASTKSRPTKAKASWLYKVLGWLFSGAKFLFLALVLAWATLAIYYSTLPWAWLRLAAALAFMAFGIWALWLTRRRGMRLAFAGLFLVVLVGWSFILPSHDRPWRPEVAVMPRAIIDGDRVRITGVRDFDYTSRDDFTGAIPGARGVALASDFPGFLRVLLDGGTRGAHLREFQLR